MVRWCEDDPMYLATVEVEGRPIKLRSTPESDAFLSSLIDLTDAEEILSASVWVGQKAEQCVSCPEALGNPRKRSRSGAGGSPRSRLPAGERFFEAA